jgi:hypothetical protein
MDFDPRDYDDPRDRDDRERDRDQDHERHDSSARPDLGDSHDRGLADHAYDVRDRDEHDRHDDDHGPHLGRGPSSEDDKLESDPRDRDDERWPDRARDHDPREVFTRDLNLPRGLQRELVRDRDREYTLRGSETRTLATVGAFRVVSSRDLPDRYNRPLDPRSGDLRHLREQRLVETVRVPGSREHAVALTREGRSLLERHRDRDQEDRQTFWASVKRERELEHDLQHPPRPRAQARVPALAPRAGSRPHGLRRTPGSNG